MSASKKEKKKKDPFAVRMKRRGREFINLGHVLAKEPGKFPGALLSVVRRSIRTVWDAKGGGLYASGYVVTFVWLEVNMFIEDIASADSVSDFFSAQVFEMLFRYFSESIVNMFVALIWPVFVIGISPPWGVIALILAFATFDRVLKNPLESWLKAQDEASKVQDSGASSAKDRG